MVKIIAEDVGISKTIVSELKGTGVNVESFVTSNKNKHEMILNMMNSFENQTLLIPPPQ